MNSRLTSRVGIVADSLVISSGLFCLLGGLLFVLLSWLQPFAGVDPASGGGAVAIGLGPLALVAGTFGGPLLNWRLHDRAITRRALLGGLLGAVLVLPATAMLAPLLAALLGLVLRPFTTWEFAGPVMLFGLVTVAFLGLAVGSVVARAPGERRALFVARATGLAMILLLGLGLVVAVGLGAPGETGEAWVFAMLMGFSSAAATLGANLLSGHGLISPSPVPASGPP